MVGNTVGSLSEAQRELIIGCLLGDGSMRCKTNALLEINHSFHQRSYVDFKFRRLTELVRTPPCKRNGNGNRVAYRFVTRSLPELTPFYRLFYVERTKVIPELELTPLTMAVWFMDDGSRSRSAVYLNKDKCYKRIRLSVEGTRRFVQLIEPHLLPEFRYKLPHVTP